MVEDSKMEEKQKNTVSVSVSGFPMSSWIEWEKDCIKNYGDCRWLKMWADHQSAQRFFILDSVFRELAMIRTELQMLKGETENSTEEEEEVQTLGGKDEKLEEDKE